MKVGDLKVMLRLDAGKFKAAIVQAKAAISSFKTKAVAAGAAIGAAFAKIGPILQRLAMAAGAAFTGMMVAFARFEDAIHRTAVIIGKGTAIAEKEYKALESTAIELGKTTLFTATQAAKGMTILAKAGLSTKEVMGTVGEAINLAIAGGTDMDTAAKAVVTTMKQFNLEVEDAAKITDMLTVAANSALIDVEGMGNAMKYAGALSHDFGMSLEDTMALVASMADAGYEASQAGTALRAVYSRLAKGIPAVNKGLQNLGINIKDSTGHMLPMIDIIAQLQKAAKKNNYDLKYMGDLINVVGVRAGGPFSSLIGRGSNAIKELSNDIKNSTGAAKRMADEFRTTTKGRFMDLIASVNTLSIVLGKSLDGAMAKSLFGLRNWVVELTNAWQANDKLKVVLDGLKAGFSPLIDLFARAGAAIIEWVKTLDSAGAAQQLEDIFLSISNTVVNLIDTLTAVDWGLIFGGLMGALKPILKTLEMISEAMTLIRKVPESARNMGKLFSGQSAAQAFVNSPVTGDPTGVGKKISDWVGGMFKKTEEASETLKQSAESQKEAMNTMVDTVALEQGKLTSVVQVTGDKMAGEISGSGEVIGNTLTNIGSETVNALGIVESEAMKYGTLTNQSIAQLAASYRELSNQIASIKTSVARQSQRGTK